MTGTQQDNWWSLCFSLLERTRDNVLAAPKYIFAWSVLFYTPIIVFQIVQPISDKLIAIAVGCGLYAGAIVLTSATSWVALLEIREGATPTLAGAIKKLGPLALAVTTTALTAMVLETLGMLIIAPGALFFFWIMLTGPITCEEGLKGWPAIERSRRFLADFRWSEIAIVLSLAFIARTGLGLVPQYLTSLYLIFASDVPSILEWLMHVLNWSIDIAILGVLSTWVCVAYFDIADLMGYFEEMNIGEETKEEVKTPAPKMPDLEALKAIQWRFTPSPRIKAFLPRIAEGVLLTAISFLSYHAIKPPALFERPPSSLVFSNMRLVANPSFHLEGHVQNDSGQKVRKAVWLVKLPRGTPGVPPSLTIQGVNNGDGRDFSIPIPVQLGEVPELKPFKIEWE